MSDRWGAQSVTWWVLWVSWICLFLLSYPQTQLQVQTVNGIVDFHIGLNATLFTVLSRGASSIHSDLTNEIIAPFEAA